MENKGNKTGVDEAIRLLQGGEWILLLQDFWKALRSALPASRERQKEQLASEEKPHQSLDDSF